MVLINAIRELLGKDAYLRIWLRSIMKKWFYKYLKNLWGHFIKNKPNKKISINPFCLGDHVILKRRLGTLEEGSVGIILDIDSQGNLTIKMVRSSDVCEYVIMVNDIDVLEKE